MADELAEFIADKTSVVVIEWGDIVADVLPAARMTIKFEVTGENSRKLKLSYPKELEYLIPA